MIFTDFVKDYTLDTVFESFLVFIFYVDTRLFKFNPFW